MADDDNLSHLSPFLRQQITQCFPRNNQTLIEESEEDTSSLTPPVVRPATTQPVSTNITWSSLAIQSTGTPVPEVGGLYKDPEGKIIPFVGTNSDAKVNVFSYNESLQDWECDVTIFHHLFTNKQGPVHMG